MSTKTTFKRVALVAVAALGLGVLSSVAPASATDVSISVVDSISATSSTYARVGTLAYIDVTLTDTGSGIVSGTDTATIVAKFVNSGVPTTSAAAAGTRYISVNPTPVSGPEAWATVTDKGSANVDSSSVALTRSSSGFNYVNIHNCTSATNACKTADIKGAVSFIPDVAGSYQVLVFADKDADGVLDAGEVSSSVTVITGGVPASLTVAKVSSGTPSTSLTAPTGGVTTGFNVGAIYSITAKDASAHQVYLTADETIALSASTTTTAFAKMSAQTSAVTGLARTDAVSNGTFYVTVNNSATASESTVLTATGGGTATGISGSVTASFVTPTATDVSARGKGSTGFSGAVATWLANNAAVLISAATSGTVKYTVNSATAIEALSIKDVDGQLTGYLNALYTQTATAAATIASFTAPAVEALWTYTLAPYDDDTVYSETFTSTVAAEASTTITPAPVRSATGAALTFTSSTVDTFGAAIAGVTVVWAVNGVTTVASTNKVTDADGATTFTYTTGATAGTDTVTADDGTATVTLVTDLGVSTVLVTTPNTSSLGVLETVKTYTDIDASASGASNTSAAVSATVKDASGNLLTGVPVTFTVTGTGVDIVSTEKVSYTTAGVATAHVYAWKAGTYTVTATAGGKTGTNVVNFTQKTDTEARNITATVSGSIVTAKVTDRFGNGVYNAPVYATRTGAGNFAGTSKTNSTTDYNGEVEFVVSGGSADVTISLGTVVNYGQSGASAGLVSSATATDIFTAYVAGTATTAGVGVGASSAPAGTNSATASVSVTNSSDTAADAAAEATDAANAATDAANAAAEAADAATAAAQDAADAVAALSAQVATLISGLKAQLTALTNLVIKIQKKVKA